MSRTDCSPLNARTAPDGSQTIDIRLVGFSIYARAVNASLRAPAGARRQLVVPTKRLRKGRLRVTVEVDGRRVASGRVRP